MVRRDLPEVLGIERGEFEFPWALDDFVRCLRQRNCIGLVAETGDERNHGRVLAFTIYELHKTRLHLLNLAVAGHAQRSGVGQAILKKLKSRLSSQQCNRITLEVRETNLPAQCFFRSSGFRAVRVLREFYEDTPEDAYLMEFRLRTSPCSPCLRG
jgi:ribosomal-protein-alanine N-acetyltransferase